MNRRWLYAGLLAVGGIGLVTALRGRPKIHKDTRLLLIGDSLANGLDTPMRMLAKEEGIAYLGNGIVGTRIDQWDTSPWLDNALATFRPNLVLVSLGTNDEYMAPGAVSRQSPHIETLLRKLEAAGAKVVWIGVPKLPKGQGIAELVEERAPYHFPSRRYAIPRGPDQIHPTASGYAGWAGAIWSWLS